MRNRQGPATGPRIAFRPPRQAEILFLASPTAGAPRPPTLKDSVRQCGRPGQSPAVYRTWWRHFPEAAQIRRPRSLRTNATRSRIGPRLENRLRRHIAEPEVRSAQLQFAPRFGLKTGICAKPLYSPCEPDRPAACALSVVPSGAQVMYTAVLPSVPQSPNPD